MITKYKINKRFSIMLTERLDKKNFPKVEYIIIAKIIDTHKNAILRLETIAKYWRIGVWLIYIHKKAVEQSIKY